MKWGSELHLLTPLPGLRRAPRMNNQKLDVAVFYNDFGTFSCKMRFIFCANPANAPGEPKAGQRDPKGSQRHAKGRPRTPQREPKGVQGSPRAPQREPGLLGVVAHFVSSDFAHLCIGSIVDGIS